MRDEPTHSEVSTTPSDETISGIAKRLGPASILAAGAMFLPPLGSIVLLRYINDIGQWLRGHGSQGVAIYIAGFAVFAGVALLPTYASAILGGWAFGFRTGLLAALAGFLGGAIIGYCVARPTASARVGALIAEKPRWKAIRDALVGGSFLKTLGIVTLVRLPPNSPFAFTNLVLASVRVPTGVFLLGTALGMLPRTALVVWLASQFKDQLAKDVATAKKPWWLFAAMIVGSVVVMGVVGVLAKRALARLTAETTNSLAGGAFPSKDLSR